MSKAVAKKTSERRKRARGGSAASAKAGERRKQPRQASGRAQPPLGSRALEKKKSSGRGRSKVARPNEQECFNCSKDLRDADRALLVEEDLGRVFCSESCISEFFSPEIGRLEKEYFKFLTPSDLSADEREKYNHLRWITLEEPDEVWREKTLQGDYRYTLISEFRPGARSIWCVCICLFLRGEPSFLYLAFPTRNAAMANLYRRGERMQWLKPKNTASSKKKGETTKADPAASRAQAQTQQPVHGANLQQNHGGQSQMIDGLADAWTPEETLRAQISHRRADDDIPAEEYELYQACMEETLEDPEELWILHPADDEDGLKIYHFIRHYPDEKPGVWFVIVARETEDEEQIEILDAFPTRDRSLVARYRQGTQEIGGGAPDDSSGPSRLVH